MRLRGWVFVAATVVALTAVSGCGGGSEDGAERSDGYGQSAGSGGRLADAEPPPRPSAATMSDIETFVSQRTTCRDLHMEDSADEEDPEAPAVGKAWGIKERAVCWDDKGMGITLMSIGDMKTFQVQAKRHNSAYLVGADFAIFARFDQPTNDLKDSGLLALVCDPETRIPSGYKREKALVDGCTLTDFFP
ncbi:hypothetical protein ACIBI8_09295 [Streptomyces sp. NPDC050529]|uniref:hypothetical protein n=1 Tax=unclassified Streptomyces TaxID=2593676 RepID=UPI002DDBBFF1|nr:hypothetical protein [Streptomyces sp. NBC_01022]WRZ79419.1 hypothetical protein OG316_03650 [Streptomyces sp. NBC_01022]WRZ86257.1 hypothetical protein OG316_41245 [Streptomyces sp. NBC_01022]